MEKKKHTESDILRSQMPMQLSSKQNIGYFLSLWLAHHRKSITLLSHAQLAKQRKVKWRMSTQASGYLPKSPVFAVQPHTTPGAMTVIWAQLSEWLMSWNSEALLFSSKQSWLFQLIVYQLGPLSVKDINCKTVSSKIQRILLGSLWYWWKVVDILAQQPIKLHSFMPCSWSNVLIGWNCFKAGSESLCLFPIHLARTVYKLEFLNRVDNDCTGLESQIAHLTSCSPSFHLLPSICYYRLLERHRTELWNQTRVIHIWACEMMSTNHVKACSCMPPFVCQWKQL